MIGTQEVALNFKKVVDPWSSFDVLSDNIDSEWKALLLGTKQAKMFQNDAQQKSCVRAKVQSKIECIVCNADKSEKHCIFSKRDLFWKA